MDKPGDVSRRLNSLKMRLDQVSRAWSVNDYESLLKFYVSIIPSIMEAERCGIFVVEPGADQVYLKCGTGLQEREIVAPMRGSVVGEAISSGECIIRNDLDRQPGFHKTLVSKTKFVTHTMACAPIRSLTEQSIAGAIQVLNKEGGQPFTEDDGRLLQEVADYLAMAIENILINDEMLLISSQLNHEIQRMWQPHEDFIAESRLMQNVLDKVQAVSATPVSVLIQGESGTGKEVIARMIHACGDRKDEPFVAVNCASIPENLMESEFFGYEKGAFTGAVTSRKGRFEEAHGGSLFLDEVGEMPSSIQAKFLRALQEGEGCRLGSNTPRRYDVRIISATNRDLEREVAAGSFREDLFYRLFSVEISLPPLRERREDIIPLAAFFLGRVSERFGRRTGGFAPDVVDVLEEYPWPGNVRQLQHEIERLVALTPEGEKITLQHSSSALRNAGPSCAVLEVPGQSSASLSERVNQLEIECIQAALKESAGNKRKTSRLLGITRQGLDKKIKRYGIDISAENNK
jgi:transcriptional regulator with GAF, ATPase, and Fis domain